MSHLASSITKWLWCFLAISSGPAWKPASGVTASNPPKNPATVQAQAKFFQDFFSVQLSPYKVEFGHVCEDPNTWEQRYEKKDFKNHRAMGKVRWGDKKGGYGEHYWDLNHAGHNNDNDNGDYDPNTDEGSYDTRDNSDAYDEPSDLSPNYEVNKSTYDPEKASLSQYDEIGRSKRHHPRIKIDRKIPKGTYEEEHESDTYKPRKNKDTKRTIKDQHQAPTHSVEQVEDSGEDIEQEQEEYVTKKPKQKVKKVHRHQEEDHEDYTTPEVNKPAEPTEESQDKYYAPRQQKESSQFVPYEQGAGVRQHYPSELAAASTPRLFLEPSTGHVVDRATGQAYVLQPIIPNINYQQ